jgi:hypothetical protein
MVRTSVLAVMMIAWARASDAQLLTGALIGTVTDAQGAAIAGARVRLDSPALIGGALTLTTNATGHLRFPVLPPGRYTIDIDFRGFTPFHEGDIEIGGGATLERRVELRLAGVAESLTVSGAGSRLEARDPGFGTRFSADDLKAVPTRRASMFDWIRAAPGVSATSPSSGTTTTVSAFGSGANENQFLIDGTNTTCPCNGVARSEPGVDFIQEVQVQSVGASAEFGNVQGAVVNVITRQGSARFLYDASGYAQTASLTSQPVRLDVLNGQGQQTGYERERYRDFTTNLGGPVVRDRLWFFTGYQYLRDYDSQPGTDPLYPRTYEQDKVFAKLTWRLSPKWQLVQSFHKENWVNPEAPTVAKPFATTLRTHATVPATTFGHLTHSLSSNTVWDVRLGRFNYSQESRPNGGDGITPSRLDLPRNIFSGAPPQFSDLTLVRTTAKATISHFAPHLLGGDHQWKAGAQVERGEHHGAVVIPTGVRYVYANGVPSQRISSDPANTGGVFITPSAFITDAFTIADWLTINAGIRYDHSRAVSQDLPAVDADGEETDVILPGLGTLYTWDLRSPRLGVTARLTADGRTILRASFGRFYPGVLTGELAPFHPGATATTTQDYVAADLDYTGRTTVVSSANLQLDSEMRAPRTDESSIGLDREIAGRLGVAVAFVHKSGRDFIGWSDVGGRYAASTRTLADGRSVPVQIVESPAARIFRLSNPSGYSMTYDGLVIAAEKRRSHGWQAFGSYTLSRVSGLQASSGATAAGAQVSTVAPPPAPGLTFGRDPNDLTNAGGRLPNDRPHMLKIMGSVDVPRTGIAIAGNLQHLSGKPWAAAGLVNLRQNPQQRILLEPRGTRRLSPQALLDVRVSRTFAASRLGGIDLLLDLLNVLNETAEESIVSDVIATESVAVNPDFGKPNAFVDPRRLMIGVRVNLGRP